MNDGGKNSHKETKARSLILMLFLVSSCVCGKPYHGFQGFQG